MASLDVFLDAVHDFSSLPLVAIEQQPGKVEEFLERIGGIDVLLGALATPIDDVAVRDEIARCFRSVLASTNGRMALASYPLIAPALLTGLRHDDEFVRQIASEQMLGLYSQDPGSNDIQDRLWAVLAADDVFGGVLEAIADPSTSVSENVANLIVIIGDVSRFFSSKSCARLKRIADQDATVLVRVLALAVRMANISTDAFVRFKDSGLMDELMGRIMNVNDDPLLTMSLLGVLVQMTQSQHGLHHLTQIPLGALIRRFAPGAVDTFVTSSALNMIDEIVNNAIKFDMFNWITDPDLRYFLTASIESQDDTILEPAISAIASIGKCYVGLCEFARDQHDLLLRLPRIAMRPSLPTNALIIASLHGLATVFSTRYDRAEQGRADALRKALIQGTLDPNRADAVEHALRFMSKIKKWCCNVENDLRVATYRFLSEFGRLRFGLQAMMSTSGLVETLLDRQHEHDSKANLWRFTVIQVLSTNPFLDEMSAVTPGLSDQIRQYVHEGPYHKGTSMDVAVL